MKISKGKIRLLFFVAMLAGVFGLAKNSFAADVFYSVGQNTNDHKTGTPTMDIASGTATFSTAQIGNIGVGDKVTYNTTSIAYISSKISQTEWNLVTATGTAPADVTGATVNSISHTFSSLQGAIAGADDLIGTLDLVTGNYTLNIPCYQDSGPDTTAVTIDGYTTGPSNYIKIYTPYNTSTEVNYSQRHEGRWDDGKFWMLVAGDESLNLRDEFVWIDGLQIDQNSWAGIAVFPNNLNVGAEIKFSNNIVKGDGSTAGQIGIAFSNMPTMTSKIWNCVFYNYEKTDIGTRPVYNNDGDATMYVYNTIAQGGYYGFRGTSEITAKNCISIGATDGFSGGFSAGSTNNASDVDDSDAPATNRVSIRLQSEGAVVTDWFAGSSDFHISSDAIFSDELTNAGADLSSDPYLPFLTDIDGQTRSVWDIGADEAANDVFYSVGQNVLDHKTGNPTVTISGTTATFSEDQTATNMGVGDVIDYDTDNKKCYISGKISTTIWSCVSTIGEAPIEATDVTVNSISHVFNSVSAAESGAPTLLGTSDLTSANVVLKIPCYYDSGSDTTAVTISGYTTGPSNYIKIYTPHDISSEVNQSQRHQGKWDQEKYRIETASPSHFVFEVHENYVKFDGLQMKLPEDNDGGYGIIFDQIPPRGIEVEVSNNIIRGTNPQTYTQVGIQLGALYSPGYAKIYNNIIYDTGQLAGSTGINHWHNPWTPYVYNNTVINSYYGYKGCGDNENDFWRNNIAQDCHDGFRLDYGSWGSGSDYNISDIAADAPGVHSKNGTSVSFADESADDFHLLISDTSARNAGINLSSDANFPFSKDVDSQARMGVWDIGADETANDVFYSVGQTVDNLMTGTPTITISGGTANFSVAQTGNMGVGDRVTYDTSTVAYISGKTSQTEWTLTTATGGVPADITDSTVVSITREYTSLASAIAGAADANHVNSSDLTSANVVLNIPCYYDTGADTAAVNITGYTTGVPNYIKIYTPNDTSNEANNSQRHEGNWDEGKYQLIVTSETSSDFSAFDIDEKSVRIDGLQIKNNKAAIGSTYGIDASTTLDYSLYLSNNLIKGPDYHPDDDWMQAIFTLSGTKGNAYIWNNIFYDWGMISNKQKAVQLHFTLSYFYNNTIHNSYLGVNGRSDSIHAFNNIVQDSVDGFNSGYADDSDYNISDLPSDAPGANSKNSTEVSFIDGDGDNFHLSSDDVAAKNAGTNLSSDAYLSFSTDIDGHTRSTWDIGADEAADNVFYSVGQNTDDHRTCTDNDCITNPLTVTVSGTTATFSAAQTATNIGVGDIITYNTSDKCYISGKTSTTIWSCVSATGEVPAAAAAGTTVNSIVHAFDSLSAAEAGASALLGTSDLVTGNYILNIPCYYDTGADTTAVTVDGYITGPSNYIKIYTPNNTLNEVNQSQRHQGKWSEDAYNMDISSGDPLTVSDEHVIIDGLQLYKSHTDVGPAIHVTSVSASNSFEIKNNIIKSDPISINWQYGIRLHDADIFEAKIYNNLIYDFNINGGGYGVGIDTTDAVNTYIYNNTILNCYYGIRLVGGSAIAKNNIVKDAGDVNAYEGTFASGTDYNATDGIDDIGTGSNNKISQAFSFVDESNDDFHLSNTDIAARDAGTNLSNDPYLAFSDDIDGESRNIGGAWDIGADEAGTSAKIKGGVRIDGGVKIFKQ